MKISFIIIALVQSLLSISQEFNARSVLLKNLEISSQENYTDITITESEIILKKYLDNGTIDLIRVIERIESKPYNAVNCTWYYCIAREKDIFRNEYRKSIFIYDKTGRSLLFADFVSEVDVFWKKFFF